MQSKSLGLAAAAMMAMAAAPSSVVSLQNQTQVSASEARVDQQRGAPPASQTYRNAEAMLRGWARSNPASRRRWPGRGWSVKAGQRMAAKRRNVLRNRRAQR